MSNMLQPPLSGTRFLHSISNSCEQFRDVLKTHLFKEDYTIPLRTYVEEGWDFELERNKWYSVDFIEPNQYRLE